ncbi:MAG: FAD-binding oxidoreductase [Acidimicrobiia bacterium]|nr:FAD-binding oxidoreductase [Acidimicrobiia bacterium]
MTAATWPAPPPAAEAHAALVGIVGAEHVRVERSALAAASRDVTENPEGHAEAVVAPAGAGEVAALLAWANEHRVPVTPVVANQNLGGLALPVHGGVVCDLRRLDRIVTHDAEAGYVVVEPGVTFGMLATYLDENLPDRTYSWSFSPPETSVLANALLDGLGTMSNKFGSQGLWINGLEVVLADGTTAHTGAWAVSDVAFGRAPLPDLTGLFVNFQGSTGIATKAALQLAPKLAHTTRRVVLARDLESAFALMRTLGRCTTFDDVAAMTWPVAKLLFGAESGLVRDPDEPEAMVVVDVSANTPKEMEGKLDVLATLRRDAVSAGHGLDKAFDMEHLVRLVPRYAPLARMPTTLDFMLDHPGGGLTWVGTYGPTSRWEEGAREGCRILDAAGFPPIVVTRPMATGHYGVLRFICLFDRDDPADVERTRRTMVAVATAMIERGYIPYKTPSYAVDLLLERADPGFTELLGTVKRALDPNGIMNPGRWGFGPPG